MFKLTKFAFFFGALTMALASQMSAAAGNQSVGSNSAPSANCIKIGGLCSFENLQPKETGNAASFYCEPKTATRFTMENYNVLITGFDDNGYLSGSASELNKYYFDAYKAPHPKFIPTVTIRDEAGKPVTCKEGRGNNRVVYPGMPKF